MRFGWAVFRGAGAEWYNHNAPRLGAALAYYAVLSAAPMAVLFVAVAGLAFGEEAVRGRIYYQIRGIVGGQNAAVVQNLLKSAHRPAAGTLASILGFLMLLIGASGVFLELRDTLNYIWDAPPRPSSGVTALFRDRIFSFALVLGLGFLLTISLALSAILQAAGAYSGRFVSVPTPVLELINFLITFIVMSFLFALIYRVIPEVRVDWEDVTIGAVITAALFTAGKFLIGLYLGKAGVGSAYGAAGSLVILLVWVYYSAQIFIYGAEFTHVWAQRRRPGVNEVKK